MKKNGIFFGLLLILCSYSGTYAGMDEYVTAQRQRFMRGSMTYLEVRNQRLKSDLRAMKDAIKSNHRDIAARLKQFEKHIKSEHSGMLQRRFFYRFFYWGPMKVLQYEYMWLLTEASNFIKSLKEGRQS